MVSNDIANFPAEYLESPSSMNFDCAGRDNSRTARHRAAFTLIELSIVLVIIGLIVGGVLVGRDLIRAAEIRATVSQYQKYNAAVNTFRTKFNCLPGDCLAANANASGLFQLAGAAGQGDGNGLIEDGAPNGNEAKGETLAFWRHLSDASLVDGSFGLGGGALANTGNVISNVTTISESLPLAKLGGGMYFLVYSYNGTNYFSLLGVTAVNLGGTYFSSPTTALTPVDAYNIDIKMDDGLPSAGIVTALGASNPSSPMPAPSWNGPTACEAGPGPTATSPADTYNLTNTTPACALSLRFN